MKIIIAAVLAMIMMLTLVACGGKQEPSSSNSTSAETNRQESIQNTSAASTPEVSQAVEEFTGKLDFTFGDYVAQNPENPERFAYDQVLSLREDKTCSLLGDEYTWIAEAPNKLILWQNGSAVGLLSCEDKFLWFHDGEKAPLTFCLNLVPANYTHSFRVVSIAYNQEESAPERIEFRPGWEVVVNGTTYHLCTNPYDERALAVDETGEEAFEFYWPKESTDSFPESGIIKLVDRRNRGSVYCGQYLDESADEFIELNEENFLDYFELVSMAEAVEEHKDAFGDFDGVNVFMDYIQPKDGVAAFGYSIKLSRSGRAYYDIVYHADTKELTINFTEEDPEYRSDMWTDAVFTVGTGRSESSSPTSGYLYLSIDGSMDRTYLLSNFTKDGDTYTWNQGRMSGLEVSRVTGLAAIKK